MTERQWYTVREFVAMTGVSETTVRRHIRAGEEVAPGVRAVSICGKARIPKASVDALLTPSAESSANGLAATSTQASPVPPTDASAVSAA